MERAEDGGELGADAMGEAIGDWLGAGSDVVMGVRGWVEDGVGLGSAVRGRAVVWGRDVGGGVGTGGGVEVKVLGWNKDGVGLGAVGKGVVISGWIGGILGVV